MTDRDHRRTNAGIRSWVEYWNGEHALYVNARHKALNAEHVAADIARHVPHQQAVVLDFGCGEALYGDAVKRHCGRLLLCDAAEVVRSHLQQRLTGRSGIEVLAPEDLPGLVDGSLDLVVVNSVIQYIDREGFGRLLDLWRAKLKPEGYLVIADVIPPGVTPLTDALSLLRFAWRGGFLLPTLGGLIKTALSDYSRIRKELGFSIYSEAEFIAMLSSHGLTARRVHPNFGHNQARMTFSAQATP